MRHLQQIWLKLKEPNITTTRLPGSTYSPFLLPPSSSYSVQLWKSSPNASLQVLCSNGTVKSSLIPINRLPVLCNIVIWIPLALQSSKAIPSIRTTLIFCKKSRGLFPLFCPEYEVLPHLDSWIFHGQYSCPYLKSFPNCRRRRTLNKSCNIRNSSYHC